MTTTLFQTDLNKYCQKFLVLNNKTPSLTDFLQQTKEVNNSIFEQLLLFDTVNYNVHGENIPLSVLLNTFGIKNFENLLETKAIRFTLWNQLITHMVDDIAGVDPLQHGTYNSGPHSDPEQSIEMGFKWMKNPPVRSDRRRLKRKIRDLYELPEDNLSATAVNIARSAYESGKLDFYGLANKSTKFNQLNLKDRGKLGKCAEEILQYKHLISSGMTSYNNFEFYKIFHDSNKKIHEALNIKSDFETLSKIENVPDVTSLLSKLENPFNELVSLRNKKSSQKFRHWLANCSSSQDGLEITKEYIEAIANAKSFFETKKGKFTKTIALSSIGSGIGTLIAGPTGALLGASTAKIAEPIADIGLDLLDEFVLDGIIKGWTPKVFFNDIQKIQK